MKLKKRVLDEMRLSLHITGQIGERMARLLKNRRQLEAASRRS